jgi:hypothetical protein
VIQSFNKNICLLLNDKSSLCVISDIFEANIDSQFYAQIKSVINDDVKMEDFYLNYVSTYGIGVGDFGLNHLIKSKDIKKANGLNGLLINIKVFLLKQYTFKNNK